MMKILLILIIIIPFIFSCSRTVPARPRLEISNPVLDLGMIHYDSVQRIAYSIKNTGNADLIIDTVTSSCGCSTPELSKKTLAASETAILSVTYKPVDRGKFNKSLVIKSNSDSMFTVVRFRGETFQ